MPPRTHLRGMTNARRAIVIGGGIAGPAVAMFLARAGVEPVVAEAYRRVEGIGGGFQIAPNGLRVLTELGLRESVLAAGSACSDFAFRNHHGKVIGVAKTGAAGPAVNITRASLQRILRDELARRRITIQYEKRLADIALAGKEVVATFEDGSTEVGDMLIGADGIHSRVREWMLPDHAAPRDTGMVSIGGFCAALAKPPSDEADALRLTFVVGPKHQFGYSTMGFSRTGASQWGWWCHAAFANDDEREELLGMGAEKLKMLMLDRYGGWCGPTRDLIAATETWSRTPIQDVPKLPTWHRGRVVLMGDAAHAMSPAGGQGASLALEDAMVLGGLLGDDALPVEDAMKRFEVLRKSRAEAMVAQGFANDRRSLQELGAVGMWMRDNLMMPVIAPIMARALLRVYGGGVEAST